VKLKHYQKFNLKKLKKKYAAAVAITAVIISGTCTAQSTAEEECLMK